MDQLEGILLREFKGKELGFDDLRQRTWMLPFVERHYREVIKRLEGKDVVVHRITSKRTGDQPSGPYPLQMIVWRNL